LNDGKEITAKKKKLKLSFHIDEKFHPSKE